MVSDIALFRFEFPILYNNAKRRTAPIKEEFGYIISRKTLSKSNQSR